MRITIVGNEIYYSSGREDFSIDVYVRAEKGGEIVSSSSVNLSKAEFKAFVEKHNIEVMSRDLGLM